MSEFGGYVPPEVQREVEKQKPEIAGGERRSDQLIERKEFAAPKEGYPGFHPANDSTGQQSTNDSGQQGDNSATSQQQDNQAAASAFKPTDNTATGNTSGDSSDSTGSLRRSETLRQSRYDGFRPE